MSLGHPASKKPDNGSRKSFGSAVFVCQTQRVERKVVTLHVPSFDFAPHSDPGQYRDHLERKLIEDNLTSWRHATTFEWWEFWKPRNFGCKQYQAVLVGSNDALAERLCGGTTFRSSIKQDPEHIDQQILNDAIAAVKSESCCISPVVFRPYLPGGSGFTTRYYGVLTITVFGSAANPLK